MSMRTLFIAPLVLTMAMAFQAPTAEAGRNSIAKAYRNYRQAHRNFDRTYRRSFNNVHRYRQRAYQPYRFSRQNNFYRSAPRYRSYRPYGNSAYFGSGRAGIYLNF